MMIAIIIALKTYVAGDLATLLGAKTVAL